MKVTKQDVKDIQDVIKTFSKTLSAKDPAAVSKFGKEATAAEIFNIVSANAVNALPALSAKGKVKRELKVCMAALPVLKRIFDEKAIVDSLPDPKTNQRVMELCENFGGAEIAKLALKK